MQCVTVGNRRLTAEDVETELRKKDKQVDELHGKMAAGTSELAQARMDLEWAKDSQRRAEDALLQKRTRKVPLAVLSSHSALQTGLPWERISATSMPVWLTCSR